MSEIITLTQTLREAISACIYGKEDVIEKVLAALYCGGHVLLNDIPGPENHPCPYSCRSTGRGLSPYPVYTRSAAY